MILWIVRSTAGLTLFEFEYRWRICQEKNTKHYLDSGMVSEQVKDRAGVRQDCWTKACGIKFQRALTASGRETKDWQTVRPTLSRLYNDTNTQNL